MDTSIARQDGKLVRAERGIKKTLPFICPGCMQEVYAATEGNVQKPHFRHKSSSVGCSKPEHYIHWITKELFADFYQNTDSFMVEIPITSYCERSGACRKKSTHSIDLKKRYPYILVEQYDRGVKPDCMLYNSNTGETLYLEVKYTHSVSQDKINLGVPIIELSASTQNVIDDIIAKGSITIDNLEHRIYNESILLPTISAFDCNGKCSNKQIPRQQPIKSSESGYWSGIYAGWSQWKNGLSEREQNASPDKEQIDYRQRQYKDDD